MSNLYLYLIENIGVLQEYHRWSLHLQFSWKGSTTVRILPRSNTGVQIGNSHVVYYYTHAMYKDS